MKLVKHRNIIYKYVTIFSVTKCPAGALYGIYDE